jgi:hypothetical protein
MSSDPFSIGCGVHRPEYWAVFRDVDRPKPLSGFRCSGSFLHRSNVLIRQG